MKITITGIDSISNDLHKLVNDTVKELSNLTFETVKKNTPVKSGNARKNWTSLVQKDAFSVGNTTPYIERLDKGYSKQAPNGIIMPTLNQIKGKYK